MRYWQTPSLVMKTSFWWEKRMREECCRLVERRCDARRERQALYCEHFTGFECWGWFICCYHLLVMRDDYCCWRLRVCVGYQFRDWIVAAVIWTRDLMNSIRERWHRAKCQTSYSNLVTCLILFKWDEIINFTLTFYT